MEEVKTLTFDTSVSSMEYMADGEILVITYGKTIAFYNALRYIWQYPILMGIKCDSRFRAISEQLNLLPFVLLFANNIIMHY